MRPPDPLVRLGVTDGSTFAVVVIATALSVSAGAAAIAAGDLPNWGIVVTLLACALVADRQETPVSHRFTVSATGPIGVLAAVLTGPLGGWLVGCGAMLMSTGGPPAKWFTHVNLFAASCAAGGFAASSVAVSGASHPLETVCLQVLAAAAGVFAVNFTTLSGILVLRRVHPLVAQIRLAATMVGGGYVLSMPVVVLLVFGSVHGGVPVLLLTLLPLLGSGVVLRLYRQNMALVHRQAEGEFAFALGLIRALDARDAYTAGHSAAVAVYARDIARAAGYSAEEASTVQMAALLHDIGKIGVPSDILSKPTTLTSEEWAQIQRHPEIGERIAGEATAVDEIRDAIRHHHERPDGTGYPDGLSAEHLPEAAAIIGVADAYNAMTSPRTYRPALSPGLAMAELERCRGTQFLPAVVDLFIVLLKLEDEEYRRGVGARFSLAGQRDAILAELASRRQLLATAE